MATEFKQFCACGGPVSFPQELIGQVIECPHCHNPLRLVGEFASGGNRILKTTSSNTKRKWLTFDRLVGLVLVLFLLWIFGAAFVKSQTKKNEKLVEEKEMAEIAQRHEEFSELRQKLITLQICIEKPSETRVYEYEQAIRELEISFRVNTSKLNDRQRTAIEKCVTWTRFHHFMPGSDERLKTDSPEYTKLRLQAIQSAISML